MLTFGWDLIGRRAFADEVLAKAKLSTDVVESGLTRVTDQYLQDVEWDDLFRDAHKVDIVVSYAYTWRNPNRQRLMKTAARPGGRIRVFRPDYRDAATMAVLAGRFNLKPTDLETRVKEAVEDFRSLGGATVEVYLRPGDLVFSCYRFESRAVLVLYSHSRERRPHVPTFVMTGGGLLSYVDQELDAIAKQSHPAP